MLQLIQKLGIKYRVELYRAVLYLEGFGSDEHKHFRLEETAVR